MEIIMSTSLTPSILLRDLSELAGREAALRGAL